MLLPVFFNNLLRKQQGSQLFIHLELGTVGQRELCELTCHISRGGTCACCSEGNNLMKRSKMFRGQLHVLAASPFAYLELVSQGEQSYSLDHGQHHGKLANIPFISSVYKLSLVCAHASRMAGCAHSWTNQHSIARFNYLWQPSSMHRCTQSPCGGQLDISSAKISKIVQNVRACVIKSECLRNVM